MGTGPQSDTFAQLRIRVVVQVTGGQFGRPLQWLRLDYCTANMLLIVEAIRLASAGMDISWPLAVISIC